MLVVVVVVVVLVVDAAAAPAAAASASGVRLCPSGSRAECVAVAAKMGSSQGGTSSVCRASASPDTEKKRERERKSLCEYACVCGSKNGVFTRGNVFGV